MAILITLQGPDAGRKHSLEGNTTVLGRQADCTICLPAKAVSRQHAQIVQTDGAYFLEDLDSSNGTYLNGQRVRSQAALRNGDEIQVGTCRFLVELGDEADIDLESSGGADPFTSTIKLPPNPFGKRTLSGQDQPPPSQTPEKPGGGAG